MPFNPLRGMGSEARIQQIENFLAQLEGARGSSSSGLVGLPAITPPAEQIPEDQVEFDSSTGHDHYNDATYVPVYGDVSGTNAAVSVDKIKAVPVDAPVAGDDGQFLRFNNGAGTLSWETPVVGIIVQEGDVTVAAAATTVDFGSGFDITESPSGEANIGLDLSEAVTGDLSWTGNNAVVVKLWALTLAQPLVGDDGEFLRYDHGTTSYSWQKPVITVQEGDVTVSAVVTTLDFGSGFDVTAAAGEADIALDLSEVVTGDLTMSTNAATVAKIQGKAIAAPGSTQHDAFVYYDNDATSFKYARPYTWVGTWFWNGVGGSATYDLFMDGCAAVGERAALPDTWVAPLAGSIVLLQVYTSDARTAGDCAVTVLINGTPSSMVATLNGTYTTHRVVDRSNGWDIGAVTFAAGDSIELQSTTLGYTPSTGNIMAGILVVFN